VDVSSLVLRPRLVPCAGNSLLRYRYARIVAAFMARKEAMALGPLGARGHCRRARVIARGVARAECCEPDFRRDQIRGGGPRRQLPRRQGTWRRFQSRADHALAGDRCMGREPYGLSALVRTYAAYLRSRAQ